MSWFHFKKVFFERYFLASTCDAKANEFSSLTQGILIVQSYAARYMELSHFAPLDKAIVVEAGLLEDEVVQDQKKRLMPFGSQIGSCHGQWKKRNYSLGNRESTEPWGPQGNRSHKRCTRCNKWHDGECQSFVGNCYSYGKLGHKS
ncbi:uncharacterized protein LOC131156133 [Malania oleifera]|uniref:uncharacterized protein LOC131156133 n=1 Tax=Malania oleifera TaxID=397392 RepID=UPI0025ADDE63|nr:uncharacterized protein LOC131156133 [Malania oleifera]